MTHRNCSTRDLVLRLGLASVIAVALMSSPGECLASVNADEFESIQAAIDANPGRIVSVAAGKYEIDRPLRFTTDGSGLEGNATIVQTDAAQPVIVIDKAHDVRVLQVTLRRPEELEKSTASALSCTESENVVVDSVRVTNNKSQMAAISFTRCTNCRVVDSEIVNYKCIGIDDRTESSLYGYAFHCIDGTGILFQRCQSMVARSNQIIERDVLPTLERQQKYHLGELTDGKRESQLGELGKRSVHDGKVDNWHQGSAVVVSGPDESRHVMIVNNYIENAAQGVDMHCDQTICSGNIVNKAFIGLKAMHGSRNLILSGNLLTGIDLWGILLMPGSGSHFAVPATEEDSAQPSNVDGGTVIANNIITDFGQGNDYWNFGGSRNDLGSSYAIMIGAAQLQANPPLRDVLVQGNLVYDSQSESDDAREQPKYRYALFVEPSDPEPRNMRFSDNLFAPGTQGVSNIDLMK